jgi:dihydroneopterin aldolase
MHSILLSFGAIDPRLATHCRALSLREHEVMVRIGIHEFERDAPQRIWFDVDLCVKLDLAPAAKDDISETVDYDFVRETIFEHIGDRHHELQESLCDAICDALLQRQDIHAVRVATRKPDVYLDSASVGVERVCIKPW